MDLSFTIDVGPRQRSHSQARIPRDSWPYFIVSDSRLPQPGGPGPRISIHQEQGGSVIPPGTEFGKNYSPTSLWYDFDRIENDVSNISSAVACIRCRGNVFTEPLLSNNRIHI
jgi:hypothetical protein